MVTLFALQLALDPPYAPLHVQVTDAPPAVGFAGVAGLGDPAEQKAPSGHGCVGPYVLAAEPQAPLIGALFLVAVQVWPKQVQLTVWPEPAGNANTAGCGDPAEHKELPGNAKHW